MGGRFDGANLALGTAGHDRESGFHGGPFVIWVDFEIAKELFGCRILPIERLQVRSWAQTDFGNHAGKLGSVFLALRDRACHRINDDVLRPGIVLGSVRIFDAYDVAGALDERVLKASAGAKERPVAAPRELDSLQHAIKALVGTARRGPDSIKAFQQLLSLRFENGRGRNPL